MNNEITVNGVVHKRVSRLAKTGDKILVTGYSTMAHPMLTPEDKPPSNGEVFTVEAADSSGDVYLGKERKFAGFVYSTEYVVLEPVTDESVPAPTLEYVNGAVGHLDVKRTVLALIAVLLRHGVLTLDDLIGSYYEVGKPAGGDRR